MQYLTLQYNKQNYENRTIIALIYEMDAIHKGLGFAGRTARSYDKGLRFHVYVDTHQLIAVSNLQTAELTSSKPGSTIV